MLILLIQFLSYYYYYLSYLLCGVGWLLNANAASEQHLLGCYIQLGCFCGEKKVTLFHITY